MGTLGNLPRCIRTCPRMSSVTCARCCSSKGTCGRGGAGGARGASSCLGCLCSANISIKFLIPWRISPISTVNYSTLRAFSIYKTNINFNIIRPPHYSYPIVTSVTDRDPLQGEHAYCHRPLNRALIPTLSHPKSGM